MITLKDKLAHLNYRLACSLLGEDGERLLQQGGACDAIDIARDLKLTDSMLTLNLGDAVAAISLDPAGNNRLKFQCSSCSAPCVHIGAALSLVLEEKMTLGLSAPPPERVPVESLSEEDLVAQALAERAARCWGIRILMSCGPDSSPCFCAEPESRL